MLVQADVTGDAVADLELGQRRDRLSADDFVSDRLGADEFTPSAVAASRPFRIGPQGARRSPPAPNQR